MARRYQRSEEKLRNNRAEKYYELKGSPQILKLTPQSNFGDGKNILYVEVSGPDENKMAVFQVPDCKKSTLIQTLDSQQGFSLIKNTILN